MGPRSVVAASGHDALCVCLYNLYKNTTRPGRSDELRSRCTGTRSCIGRRSDAANGLDGRTRYRSQLPDNPYMRPSMCGSFTVCA